MKSPSFYHNPAFQIKIKYGMIAVFLSFTVMPFLGKARSKEEQKSSKELDRVMILEALNKETYLIPLPG
jgi:hypothetical protein